ncbi:AIPR family protein [Bacillus cereus]|uniref:AIPR family protein n=1 Tax=Bacillus TaxID=1386 RepID=UPI001C3EE3A4|nr:AIPR family protein [Bacillus cereus]MDG1632681.1 AIPR family protein [Bacillus cereus]MDK7408793.1 AIPR family protein [Bacillus cereus]MDK7414437.1 AIPR family protein [Bacillus cereus]
MDPITKSFMEEFSSKHEFNNKSIPDKFELFSNYCVVSKEYNRTSFNVEDTLTGEATQGIDGLAIIVNNKLVKSTNEIDDLIELNGVLNVNFIFIQSKTSSKFDNKEILNFFAWTKSFFKSPTQFETTEMAHFIELKEYIYQKSEYMEERSPICRMYFITTGKWLDDGNLSHVVKSNIDEMENTNLFEKVIFTPCGAKEIQQMYRKTKEHATATILFEKRVTLPKIPKVKEAYFGLIPFSEFRKIIIDETDKIKNVFDDNIRDFLGLNNDVNDEIKVTISNNRDFFSILNNGITVVAEKTSGAGDTITIANYQIVNGCQTSHVLYDCRNTENINNVAVPLKVIITEDDDIKNQITIATNNQTAVKKEELEALSDFQRNLESYYNTIDGENKLYYERRTNQYNNSTVQKTRIVNIPTQIKTFTAMFLNNPHGVSGYYGTIARKMGTRIFRLDHEYDPYYISALAMYKLDVLFRTNKLPKQARRMRHHILMLARLKVAGNDMPEFNSKKITTYCKPLLEVLGDSEKYQTLFEEIIDIIEKAPINLEDRKVFEKKETTDILLSQL